MTVKELRDQLEMLPGDAEIVIKASASTEGIQFCDASNAPNFVIVSCHKTMETHHPLDGGGFTYDATPIIQPA